MTWMQEEDALRAKAVELRQEAEEEFPLGWWCRGGARLLRRAEELEIKAWRLVGKHKFGPPRHRTARFEQFLV